MKHHWVFGSRHFRTSHWPQNTGKKHIRMQHHTLEEWILHILFLCQHFAFYLFQRSRTSDPWLQNTAIQAVSLPGSLICWEVCRHPIVEYVHRCCFRTCRGRTGEIARGKLLHLFVYLLCRNSHTFVIVSPVSGICTVSHWGMLLMFWRNLLPEGSCSYLLQRKCVKVM